MRHGWRLAEKFFREILPFFRRHLRRALAVREKLRLNEDTYNLFLAGLVGVIGGVTNLVFFACVEAMMRFVLRGSGDLVEIAQRMEEWQRLITPTLGGLAAGLALYLGLRLAGSQGASNMLEVVVSGNGKLPMRTAAVKALSSLISIGTGASIGREGSITQLTATFASKLGQFAKWPPYRLRLLVACGAASGMAAAYNAPVAASIFAAHIVLGSFAMNVFAPLVFASVVATMVSRYFEIFPFYGVPDYTFNRLAQLPWFIVLGIGTGILAAVFLKLLSWSEELFARIKVPIYWRLALGGLIVGILAIWYPAVWGNGYGAIDRILHDPMSLSLLGGLFIAKLIAILASVGSGAVGGVFTPTLFLGAAAGGLFGGALQALGWTTLPTGAFALVGMGAVLAGTLHAPLLAMIMIFEISLNYSIMPALMLACVISTLVSRGLHKESIYTEPLRRKGLTGPRELERLGEATERYVGELMRDPVAPVSETTTFREIADRFLTGANNFLPVIDAEQKLVGVVALHDMKEYLHAGHELGSVIAYDIMRPPPPCLMPNQKLIEVFPVLLQSELRNVPVINNQFERRLVGSVIRSEALNLLSDALSARRAA